MADQFKYRMTEDEVRNLRDIVRAVAGGDLYLLATLQTAASEFATALSGVDVERVTVKYTLR